MFSCCMSDAKPKAIYESPSPSKKAVDSKKEILTITVTANKARTESPNIHSATLEASSSSNITHSLATNTFSTMSLPEVKITTGLLHVPFKGPNVKTVRQNDTTNETKLPLLANRGGVAANTTLARGKDTSQNEVKFPLLPSLTPIPQLDRSLDELKRIRQHIGRVPEEGYQRLATWLTSSILAGPKGRMSLPREESKKPLSKPKEDTDSYLHYQKAILNAITEAEILRLGDFDEIIDSLSLQENIRTPFSLRIIRQLVLSKKEKSYRVLAKLIGKSELPIYTNHEAGAIGNSLECQEELVELLSGTVIEQVIRNVDLIEFIYLNTALASKLFKSIAQVPEDKELEQKGLALFCRCLSNPTVVVSPRHIYTRLVQPIAEGFIAHLAHDNKPPMTMALNSPLWNDIHNYLRTIKAETSISYAMEWFIAGMNLMTTVNCDLFNCLKGLGYNLADLTQDVRNKITYLCLDEQAREKTPNKELKKFISTFNKLQVLRLADNKIRWLPAKCKNLKRLSLWTPKLMRLASQMRHLEYLNIHGCLLSEIMHIKNLQMQKVLPSKIPPLTHLQKRTRLPASLPKLKTFIGSGVFYVDSGIDGVLSKMPHAEILEIEGDNYLPDAPRLKRLVVKNNSILEAIDNDFQLEALTLHNCTHLERLFSQVKSCETTVASD